METITFNAPWGTPLKVMTGFSLLILIGVPVIGLVTGPQSNPGWIFSMIVLPLLILLSAAFFVIRGYILMEDTLLVQRLGWASRIDLSDLNAAETDPEAMTRSIRTFGNGGLFCFAGKFRNKKLGSYRAFVTAPKRSVILRFTDRTIVVSPEEPEAFTARIRELRRL